MNANIGTLDRALRFLAGAGLIAYGVVNQSWIGALGIIPLLTSVLRFCPLYCQLGINTTGTPRSGSGPSCR